MDETARDEFESYSKTVRGTAFDISKSPGEKGEISLKIRLVKNRGELYRRDKQHEKVSGALAPEKLRSGKPAGWGCPSGGVEYNETLEDAMKRESTGESGFHLRHDRTLHMFDEPISVKKHISNIIYGFIYEADDLEIPIKEKQEIEKAAWFEIEEALSLPIVDPSRNNNPENAIYFSHREFIIDVLRWIVILDINEPRCAISGDFRAWLVRYQPLIEEKYVELLASGAVPEDEAALSALAKAGLIEWTDAETA